jgi:hypothetical protein
MKGPIRTSRESLRMLVKFAIANGWRVRRTQRGHIKFSKCGLTPIFTASTPSDYRADRNAMARLRRADRRQSQSSQEAC